MGTAEKIAQSNIESGKIIAKNISSLRDELISKIDDSSKRSFKRDIAIILITFFNLIVSLIEVLS